VAGDVGTIRTSRDARTGSRAGPERAEAPAPVRRLARQATGRALPAPLRHFMQSRFAYDFSRVRVHDDAQAADAARSVGARAYTLGSDIVFASGAFRPNTPAGLHLVAHELAHVVQQGRQPRALPQHYVVGPVDDPLERAADRAAGAVMRGEQLHVPSSASGTPALQRAVSEVCNPPSMWLALASGVTSIPIAAAFGAIAETFISASVVSTNGVSLGNFYLDNPLAGPIDPLMVAFILAKNPGLTTVQSLLVTGAIVARPDVMMHQPPLLEFEEVKPNSVAGRAAGRSKVRALQAFYSFIPLPYVAGTTYVPPAPFVIVSGTIPVPGIGPIPFKASFQITRDRAGLLVYDICIETDWVKAAVVAFVIAAAIIAALIAAGGVVPVPMPSPVPPPSLPMPVPVPVPAPPVPVPVPVPALVP
jgi:hypothetical protein